MKITRSEKIVLAGLLWIVVLFLIYAETPLGPWLNLKCLERQVKSNIDPTELQQWATNMLANHSSRFQDFEGTNLPAGLKKVKGFGHDMEIVTSRGGAVWVFCGTKGGPFLVVGPPTLVNTNFVAWKPGIYFVGQQHLFNLKRL